MLECYFNYSVSEVNTYLHEICMTTTSFLENKTVTQPTNKGVIIVIRNKTKQPDGQSI